MELPAALEVPIEASAVTAQPPDSRALFAACFQIQDRELLLRSLDVVLGSNMVDGAISIFEITNGGTPKIFKTQGPSRALTFVKGHGPHQFYLCVLRDNWCEYCSCRSFLERSRKNEPYCKHLLALKLYPLLLLDDVDAAAAVVRVETFTDEATFRAVVLQRLFPN
jgi:predicted nucleic acid-binding Zn finger protein